MVEVLIGPSKWSRSRRVPFMAKRNCWHCNSVAHMTISGNPLAFLSGLGRNEFAGLFKCDECQYPSMGLAASDHQLRSEGAPVRWFPAMGDTHEFPDVPEHIASAGDEAFRCRSIASLRGAVILARAVIEATCKDKGAEGKSLADRIDAMTRDGLIRSHTAELAHEVRHLGNDMAHGDFVEPVAPEEADEILELMSEVLQEVYQSPARLARAKEARQNRSS